MCIDGEAPGAVSLEEWIADQPSTDPALPVSLDDTVMVSSTGGTTGKPKGVMNTHRSVQTFVAHFMLAFPYGVDENAGEPGCGSDDAHRGSTDAAGNRAGWHGRRGRPVPSPT